MAFRLVIFDLGGVLVRREPERLLQRLAQEATGTPLQRIGQLVGGSRLVERFELGQLSPQQFFREAQALLGLSWSFEQFVSAWNGILSENTETTWLLPRLRSRYQLGVLSNTNILHDEYIRTRWPVFSQVTHWLASYQVGLRKPESHIYQLLLRQAGVPPREAVYVDDVKEFVSEAVRLGMTGIHFTSGQKLEQELQRVGLHV